MAVLVELALRAGEVVRRDELLDAVWGDAFVSEEVLTHGIWEIRRALGDDARNPSFLKTVPRRGYQLIAPVVWDDVEPDPVEVVTPTVLDDAVPGDAVPGDAVPGDAVPGDAPPSAPGPPSAPADTPAAAPHPSARRWLAWVAGGVAVAVLAGLAVWLGWPTPDPLRVAVLRPGTGPDSGEDLGYVSATVHAATLDTLAAWPQVAVLDVVGDARGRPRDIARAEAADEVLMAELRGQDGWVLLGLRRVRGSDGEVLWSRSFTVPAESGDSLQVADAVRQYLAEAFAEYGGRDHRTASVVSPEHYVRYLELRRRVEAGGGVDRLALLEEIAALGRDAPQFLPGLLLHADLARSLFTSSGDAAYWQRAMASVEAAAAVSPEDPRPAIWRARLLLANDQLDAARQTLDTVRRRIPGHPSIPILRSRLADAEGNAEAARGIMAQAARRYPSWQNLYRLADLEMRDGMPEAARMHLQEALGRSPANPWVLRQLGALELTYGRLERAEEVLLDLVTRDPAAVPPRINLGLVHLLEGRFDEAAASFEAVLTDHPGHALAHLNLADAEYAAGRTESARDAYAAVLRLVDAEAADPHGRMLRAQAMARLGELSAAVQLAQQTVAAHPEHAEVAYLASLVYCLAGDETSAVVTAARARELGIQPRWFRLPAFEPLAERPDFAALMDSPGPTGQ